MNAFFCCLDWLVARLVQKAGIRKPTHEFEDDDYVDAPDYSNLDSWHAHPNHTNIKNNLVEAIPDGEEPSSFGDRLVDCFFVHPTTYFGDNSWNSTIDDAKSIEQIQLVLCGQASVFNSRCRMYVPKYRQATLASFMLDQENGRAALNLAYADVLSAFHEFIGSCGGDRPYILASHSQGGWHLNRLLAEAINNGPTLLREQLICAYLVGSKVPLDSFNRSYRLLRRAESPTDHTGVVVGWDTRVEKPKIRGYTVNAGYACGHYYADTQQWEGTRGKEVLGDNPLKWATTTDTMNLITSPPFLTRQQFLSKEPQGLHVKGIRRIKRSNMWGTEFDFKAAKDPKSGFLLVEELPDPIYPVKVIRPDKKNPFIDFEAFQSSKIAHHNQDYALFYYEIRKNVEERVDKYLAENGVVKGVANIEDIEITEQK